MLMADLSSGLGDLNISYVVQVHNIARYAVCRVGGGGIGACFDRVVFYYPPPRAREGLRGENYDRQHACMAY